MRKNSFIGDSVAAEMNKTLNNSEFKKTFASPVVERQMYEQSLSEEPTLKAFTRFASMAEPALAKSAQVIDQTPTSGIVNKPMSLDLDMAGFKNTKDVASADDDEDDDEDEDEKKSGKPKKGEQPPWLMKGKKKKTDKKDDDKDEEEDDEDEDEEEDDKDEDDCSDLNFVQAFDHISDMLIRTSAALEGMGLKITAKQSLLLLNNIIEEVARKKFAHDGEALDLPIEEEISVEEPDLDLKERVEEVPDAELDAQLEDLLGEPPPVGEGEEIKDQEIISAYNELNEWIKNS